MAAISREGGQIKLSMTFSNASPVPLSGFAIQVNKNPFGLAPAQQLAVPDIAPGSAADAVLPMVAGSLLSGAQPSNPLFLQVAIKNSLDIFYFNVPFDLPVALAEVPALSRDGFSQVWQRVGDARQSNSTVNTEVRLNADQVKARLAYDNVQYVAQRQVDASTLLLYVSCSTVNNCVVVGEVSVSSDSNSIKVGARSETPALVPLFEAAVAKRLGSR
mmetsp:Transcript_46431/g.135258  ORF Transcript_46431/g.135258 Transcript_46431/m.135258 type:complete len:217 (+) Transcript_46431:39-689(+)